MSATAALVFLLSCCWFRGTSNRQRQLPNASLFNFRPVFRNGSAMAYGAGLWLPHPRNERFARLGVAFLASSQLERRRRRKLSAAMTLTILGLAGTMASVLGNEAAIRLGRWRLITTAMLASAACALALGFFGVQSYVLAAGLILSTARSSGSTPPRSPQARQERQNRRGAARRSLFIPCWATSGDSWGR